MRKADDVLMVSFNEKSKKSYNSKADNYENTLDGKFTRRFKQLLAEMIELEEAQNVLDFGCGNGYLLSLLNERKPINGFGIDVADRMIKNAKSRNPGMEFHVSGCESTPFHDCSMDVLTVCAAYHHFPDTNAFAKEAARLIKPNGKIYIAEVYFSSFLRKVCNPFIPLSKAGDVRFYSPDEIVNEFSRFGFEKIDIAIFGHIQIVSMRFR